MVDSKSDAIGWEILPLQLQKPANLILIMVIILKLKTSKRIGCGVKWILC